MSVTNPHKNLHQILTALQLLVPADAALTKCVKENMFAQINRAGFDQVMYYLCKAYDPERYKPDVWPMLDRNQERTFRNYTVAFVKDVCKETPEAEIPHFSPSFVSSPGGERFVQFLWKFGLLVLKTATERESGVPLLHYPKTGNIFLRKITDEILVNIKKRCDDLFCLILDACDHSQKLCDQILNQATELKAVQSDLTDTIHRLPLSKEDKVILLSNDYEKCKSVLENWQASLNYEADQAKSVIDKLRNQIIPIKLCSESVKTFVESKSMPTVLNGQEFLSSEDAANPLVLRDLLSKAAEATMLIKQCISMNGGFQPYNSILPSLDNLNLRLQNVAASFNDTKVLGLELTSAALKGISSLENESFLTTPSKVRLQLGQEMLQDVQTATPPLVFDAHHNAKFRFDSESPPMGGVLESMRSTSIGTPAKELNLTTSVWTSKKAPSYKTGHNKTFSTPSIPKRRKLSPNYYERDVNTCLQTPMNFLLKPSATSTLLKHNPDNHQSLNDQRFISDKDKCYKNPGDEKTSSSVKQAVLSDFKEGTQSSAQHTPMVLFPETAEDAIIMPPANRHARIAALELASEALVLGSESDDIKWDMKFETVQRTPNHNALQNIPKVIASDPNNHSLSLESPVKLLNSSISGDASFCINDDHASANHEQQCFDRFEEDISPSGRISLCPETDESEFKGEIKSHLEVKPHTEKRKSLQALIHRYRELVASSKQREAVVSPPSSPDLNKSIEDVDVDVDVDLSMDNLDLGDL